MMSSRSPGPIRSSSSYRSTNTSSCRSPVMAPGTRCLVYLKRCLAIQLQKISIFSNNNNNNNGINNFENQELSSYWMYDSGYLIFQGFLEANLKCFWNGSLIEAMKVVQFQGYIAPGVVLVTGSACALEVLRAAWARNVLKPPANYQITAVGDVEDCVVEPIAQGQFTPLPEALCWIILDMTSSGQNAVLESIYSALDVFFPEMQKPSKQLVYDTLAKLTTEKKLYQTSNGYFVMTPDTLRSKGLSNNSNRINRTSREDDTLDKKQLLLTPEEAVVVIHGDIQTEQDGDVTHQAIQTNLADVICGGNPNDKIMYPRQTAKIRSGFSAERLERRNSLKFFGRRSSSLQRSGSVKQMCDRRENQNLENSKKSSSLLSRIFRRSGRLKRTESPSPVRRPTFNAQFPPAEWFNRGVTHLHSVGTQTSMTPPDTNFLSRRNRKYDLCDDICINRRSPSSTVTPRSIRKPMSHSATLPRRTLRREPFEKDNASLISTTPDFSNNLTTELSRNPTSEFSTNTSNSCDTSRKSYTSQARKALSVASSGYNSLPRSVSSRGSKPERTLIPKKDVRKFPEISLHVSTKSNSDGVDISNECKSDGNVLKSSIKCTQSDDKSTTMTTSINTGTHTKIFVKDSPSRSLITIENNLGKKKMEIPVRPTSLYKKKISKVKEFLPDNKFPSQETIFLEEKQLVNNLINEKNDLKSKLLLTNSDTQLNNFKNNVPLSPISVLQIKNLLNDSSTSNLKENINSEPCSPTTKLKLDENFEKIFNNFQELNFTSLAAQNILKGVSFNSVDTLVEVNLAAENNKCGVNIHTDLGLV